MADRSKDTGGSCRPLRVAGVKRDPPSLRCPLAAMHKSGACNSQSWQGLYRRERCAQLEAAAENVRSPVMRDRLGEASSALPCSRGSGGRMTGSLCKGRWPRPVPGLLRHWDTAVMALRR